MKADGASLYRRCLLNEEQAWAEVRRVALDVAARRCRTMPSAAEDIASDVVLKLVEMVKRGQFQRIKDPAAFIGYVAAMAARASFDRLGAADHRRRAYPAEDDNKGSEVEGAEDRGPSPLDIAETREAWAIVKQAIDALPAEYSTAIYEYLRHRVLSPDGSYETLAAALGEPLGTVSARVSRGVQQLRRDPRVAAILSQRGRSRAPGASSRQKPRRRLTSGR